MTQTSEARRLGATPLADGSTEFLVWAPRCRSIAIDIVAPAPQRITLEPLGSDIFGGNARVGAGARYFVIGDDGAPRPDPASRFQPEGVHGPSQVADPAFSWSDSSWHGLPLEEFIIYELHVGTFTEQGTFDAARERLAYLAELGVSAIELMPVAQFPGERNWGYDGVLPFAVQNSYGGPAALKRFVDAAHEHDLAVVLDVVYNHLGPEGNYIGEFAPYFTNKYATPWGAAINVDDADSDGVRRYFIDNALEWVTDYHIDGLRLDAVHGIFDTSAYPFLAELSDRVHERAGELGRAVHLIAESDLNDIRMLRPTRAGGMGMDAQWLDDFHHSLHTLLTPERTGYYADYGSLGHLAIALRRGFVYAGHYSPYRKRRHGNQPDGARARQFVVCIQNHDQVGNRMLGERIAHLIDFERQKLAAACVLFAPYIPLMFMGEEYGEEKPFPYFIDHTQGELVEAVRQGRRQEFAAFAWRGEPPDPKAHQTFQAAIVEPPVLDAAHHQALLALHRELIALRKRHHLGPSGSEQREVLALDAQQCLFLLRPGSAIIFNFSDTAQTANLPLPAGTWQETLCTAAERWLGPVTTPAQRITGGDVALTIPPASATLFTNVQGQ